MVEKLSSPVAVALTWMLLHFLWQGSLVACVYWILVNTTSLSTSRMRYALALSMVVIMAICPIATFIVLYGSPDAIPRAETSHLTSSRTFEVPPLDRAPVHQPTVAATPFATIAYISSTRSIVNSAQPYLFFLWGVGVIFFSVRLAAGFLNILWLRSGRTAIPAAIAQRSVELARRLGLGVTRVFASTRIREAAVVGFWRPVVLLPTAWLASLPPEVLEAVIAHELAHIQRFDVWVNLLQRLLESLFFYHPAVWWLSNCVRLEREMCCDELAVQVIGERGQYAVALEQIGRLQVFGTPSLATNFRGVVKMKLHSRIQNVLGIAKAPAHEPAFLVGIGVLAIAFVLTGIVGNGMRSSFVMAQDREQAAGLEERRSEDREAKSKEDDTEHTDREKKLMQMVEKLQRELSDLRNETQMTNQSKAIQEFKSYDRNRDGELRRQEWFEVYKSPRGSHVLAEIERLKLRLDELIKSKGELHKEVQDTLVRLKVFEEQEKYTEDSFAALWNKVDSNRNEIVTEAEYLRWSKQKSRLQEKLLPFPRADQQTSQDLRTERLDVLLDRRKLLLSKYGESHPLVVDVNTLIESVEERIKAMEEVEEDERRYYQSLDNSKGDVNKRGPRDGDGTKAGPRDGDRTKAGSRDGGGTKASPRDGDGSKAGPRDRESPKVGPRDGEGTSTRRRDPTLEIPESDASRVFYPKKKSEK